VLRRPHVDYFDPSRTDTDGFDLRHSMAEEVVRELLPCLGSS
jgi:hypothetical protein